MATYRVDDFNKVKTDRYIEGDFFYTEKEFAVQVDGKLKKLGNLTNMKQPTARKPTTKGGKKDV